MKPRLWIPLLAALLELAVAAPAAIITNVVSDPNDDAFGLTVTADNWTNNSVACGYLSGYTAPYLIGAFRFTGLPLTNKTVISQAYLRVQAYLTGTGTSAFSLRGEAYDATDAFHVGAYLGARTVTTAAVTWTVSSAWAEDGVYTSPDIKTIVQEIVNRPGWASGNPIAIQMRNTASSGGYQQIYSYESAAAWGATPAQLIINYVGAAPPPDGVKAENYVSGATNSPSTVPTYLNNPTMYYPAGAGGICWATANTDIFAYWDRNAYSSGVQYWNLVDNGTAPLLQPTQPAAPGHDQAFVSNVVAALAHQYYGLSRGDEDVILEEFANGTNGLAFNATYHGPTNTTAGKSNYLGVIKTEINAGRPLSIGSWGSYFGGAHQVPVLGYKEMSNVVNSTVYIHLNMGDTQNQYVNFFASTWDNLDMDQIVPGGTPVDEYEAKGDNAAATTVDLLPDHLYEFRQTHNFSFVGDQDWVRLAVVSNRRYSIWTTNLGASADTVLTLFANDGTTQLAQDDDGGSSARASKIVWNCWSNGTVRLRATDKASGSGPSANYDLQVAYAAGASPAAASGPSPADLATGVATNPTLSWTAGTGATGYRVNFGTANPPPFARAQAGTTLATNLAPNTTYYWRIDPTNAAGITTGAVWCFTTAFAAGAQPEVLADDLFGTVSNRFGFNMNWAAGRRVVVYACTSLVPPVVWSPLQTNTFSGAPIYFFDARWTNHPRRYYRLREE
ncbi:MAG TPA: Ig-like domain-containing protein [Kiritimatiellia bacterium]|nr:Ig-like domain-containing protein [Kiritimatiellia bacterium]